MFNFNLFYKEIASTQLAPWLETLPALLKEWSKQPHGNLDKWIKSIGFLPEVEVSDIDLNSKAVTAKSAVALTAGEQQRAVHHLQKLMPWRKGPYSLHNIEIDCEWRSDLKWDRILPHLSNLQDRTILDVGCGSGYHMWRMLGAGAKQVVGIDPTALFLCQFEAVRKLMGGERRVNLLPIGIEQMQPLNAFDSVFSMGILYHCKSPLDHLTQLKSQLNKGGELILETIVIDGDKNQVLVPTDRYAKMKNIYFIPSTQALIHWLEKSGFKNVRCVDIGYTTTEEQRCTAWSADESLIDFLDPNDLTKTVEGYPAPKRAVIIANK